MLEVPKRIQLLAELRSQFRLLRPTSERFTTNNDVKFAIAYERNESFHVMQRLACRNSRLSGDMLRNVGQCM